MKQLIVTPLVRSVIVTSLVLGWLWQAPAFNTLAAPAQTTTCASPYIVKAGNTLSRIGRSHNIQWLALAQANGLTSPYRIYPGQVLCLPTALHFGGGATSLKQAGTLAAGQVQLYALRAAAGQLMLLSLSSSNNGVTLSLFAPNGVVLISASEKRATWQGKLPASGDYLIAVHGGASSETFSLSATVASRIHFARGATQATLAGKTADSLAVTYVAAARKGQVLNAGLESGANAVLAVWGFSDGQPYLRDVAGQTSFSLTLPATQDYVITVVPRVAGAVSYTLTVKFK